MASWSMARRHISAVIFRSLAVGAAAVIMVSALVIMLGNLVVSMAATLTHEEQIGWDPIFLTGTLIGILVVVVFLIGFIWEFRRASISS